MLLSRLRASTLRHPWENYLCKFLGLFMYDFASLLGAFNAENLGNFVQKIKQEWVLQDHVHPNELLNSSYRKDVVFLMMTNLIDKPKWYLYLSKLTKQVSFHFAELYYNILRTLGFFEFGGDSNIRNQPLQALRLVEITRPIIFFI